MNVEANRDGNRGGRTPVGYILVLLLLGSCLPSRAAGKSYLVCVSNERSGTVTVLDGASHNVLATIPVGKRPRGIHPSPDGQQLYVALSGSPLRGPPPLNSQGNPILKKDEDDEEEDRSDHSADGIGVVDLRQQRLIKRLAAGSDPEQFAVSADGTRLYVANEDVGTASVLNVNTGKIEHIIPVKREPEGVMLRPGGRQVYVTCETGGEVFVIDTAQNRAVAQFTVGGRPRSVAFVPDGGRAFIPSESVGLVHVVDTATFKETQTVRLPAGSRPMTALISPDGRTLYVSTGRGGTVCFIDATTYAITRTLNVGPRPWGLALSPEGDILYVANGPSNDISIVDVNAGRELRRVPAGEGPWGIAVVSKNW
jgi:YVTN family beta-propeller protein